MSDAMTLFEATDLAAPLDGQHARLGDLAETARETLAAGAGRPQRFVGLECLEPGSLAIRTWLDESAITGPGTLFRARDVLFGKLRPNLRKAALADWEGICTPEILVLRPKDDRLLPEFLALIMHWPAFQAFAVQTATGSKMPRTSWATLSRFEFRLPSIDEQRHTWTTAKAFDDAIEAERAAVEALLLARSAVLDQRLDAQLTRR